MNLAAFTITLAAESITTMLVLISLVRPDWNCWPPRESAGGKWVMPGLFYLTGTALITLGILDWGGGHFPTWLRAAGAIPWLAGNALSIWAGITLGNQGTFGGTPGLVTDGPYRWTRNPQYLGFMLGLVGWGLLTGSLLTLMAGTAACLPLYLVPRIEEPWLLERYGSEYREYLGQAPRFALRGNKNPDRPEPG